MNRSATPYKRHRFPPAIIQYAVWLYHRFNLSHRDIEDLLGHRSGRITTHYSGAELSKLIEAANRVCERGPDARPELVVLRRLSVS